MIAAHSPRVPTALRAERLSQEWRADVRDTRPRRTSLRAVFCPRCRAHRTIVVDVATWQPTASVAHLPCERCAPARTITLVDVRPEAQRGRCPVCDHVNPRPVMDGGCDHCGAFTVRSI